MITYRVNLIKFDGHATFRTHIPGDGLTEYVLVQMDRDRFNALGKPGYLDVTIAVAKENEGDDQ